MFCYIIIRNAEVSLVEIESRDRHYKRILLILRPHGCNMNVNSKFFHVILHRRFLRQKSGIKYKHCAISYIFENAEMFC